MPAALRAPSSPGVSRCSTESAAAMEFWRRPLHAMTDAFTTAGFRLRVLSEPQPDSAARDLFPDGFQDLSTSPNFLFFVVEVPPSATGADG